MLPTDAVCPGCLNLDRTLFQKPPPPLKWRWGLIVSDEHIAEWRFIENGAAAGCQSCHLIKHAMGTSLMQPAPDLKVLLALSQRIGIDPEPILRVGLEDNEEMGAIEFYSSPDSPTPWDTIGWKNFRSVENDTSSPKCLELVASWFRECVDKHACSQTITAQLPTRVIEVGSDDLEPRLLVTQGQVATFFALSHVWGDFHPLKTTKATLEQRRQGLPLTELPNSFRDAILLTRGFSVRYLWIDSLCIVQDDPDDWARESAKMADIYSNAALTIAVDDGQDCRAGFLGPREGNAYAPLIIPCWFSDNINQKSAVYARLTCPDIKIEKDSTRGVANRVAHTQNPNNTTTLLDTRGWTFQERILSPRTLHYTASEVAFECRECSRCECRRQPNVENSSLPSFLFDQYMHRISANQLFKIHLRGSTGDKPAFNWMAIVESYTKRHFTYDKDRLPALSGVAAAMAPYTPDEYACGLWVPELAVQLLWVVDHRPGRTTRRNRDGHTPSWSWASTTAPVQYQFGLGEGWGAKDGVWAEVVSVLVNRLSANPFGPANAALTLRAQLGEAVVEMCFGRLSLRLGRTMGNDGFPLMHYMPDVAVPLEAVDGEIVSILAVTQRKPRYSGQKFMSACLVLKQVEMDGSVPTYMRVGFAATHAYYYDYSGWDRWFVNQTVRVI